MAVRAALRHVRRRPRRPGQLPHDRRDEPIPRLNLSGRFYFNDDLSITRGRHNFKMGVALEYNRKTEPGSADYMGNFNFGHDANNPLSTGNGYANMLLGVFTTYTELTSRVDRDVRHWQNDFYIQDNWRCTPKLTLDLGLRVQHSGSDFEVNEMNSGFFADEWNASQAARVYRLVCTTGRAGQPGLPGGNLSARSTRPIPSVFFPSAFNGNIVPGTGNQINGIITGGIEGRKPGHLLHVPVLRLRAARRHSRGTSSATARPRCAGPGGSSTTSRDPPATAATRSPAAARSPAPARSAGRRSPTSPTATPSEPDREPGERDGRRLRTAARRSRTTSTSRSSATSASAPSRRSPTSATSPGTTAASSMSTGCRSTSTATRRTW